MVHIQRIRGAAGKEDGCRALVERGALVKPSAALRVLNDEIISCRKCPRLVEYRERVAREKRRAFRDSAYWGRAVPGFGDSRAQLFILGLAPAAHGANRTGRMFTGDRSGDFLYRLLHRAGFASQPNSVSPDDGLKLHSAYIGATCRCSPPGNKPLPEEIARCRPYLECELEVLQPRAVLALGKVAWDGYLDIMKSRGLIASRAAYPFSHGAIARPTAGLPHLFGSYHPSQQNTQTGRLTEAMFLGVLQEIKRFLKR